MAQPEKIHILQCRKMLSAPNPVIQGELVPVNHIKRSNLRTAYYILTKGIVWLSVAALGFGCATINQPPASQLPSTEQQVDAKRSGENQKSETEGKLTVMPPKTIAAWIPKGSGAFVIDSRRIFHGIGGAKSSSNPILLRASADNHSRRELSEVLQHYTLFVLEAYWSEGGGRDSSNVVNFEVLSDAFLAVVRKTLSSSRIVGHWQHPKSGEFYALCQLTLTELKDAVANDTRLERRSQEFFIQNAESLYDQFSQKSGVEAS